MKSLRHSLKIFLAAAALLSVAAPSSLFACATCFGKSDSALAQGMNWGIFTLLGFILTVLTCVALFFVHIIRKEEMLAGNRPPKTPATPPEV